MTCDVEKPFGPEYPDMGPKVAKYRRIKNPTPEQRREHAAAIEEKILGLQRAALMRSAPSVPRPACASGTWAQTAEEIEAAVRQQQRSATLAYPGKVRRERKPEEWASLYEKAMRASKK